MKFLITLLLTAVAYGVSGNFLIALVVFAIVGSVVSDIGCSDSEIRAKTNEFYQAEQLSELRKMNRRR